MIKGIRKLEQTSFSMRRNIEIASIKTKMSIVLDTYTMSHILLAHLLL